MKTIELNALQKATLLDMYENGYQWPVSVPTIRALIKRKLVKVIRRHFDTKVMLTLLGRKMAKQINYELDREAKAAGEEV